MWKGNFQKVDGEGFLWDGQGVPVSYSQIFLVGRLGHGMGLSRTECVARKSVVEGPFADSHAGRHSKT